MAGRTPEMETAIEVFVRGVGVTRSFTHPYLAEQVDGLWVMRDAPRKRRKYRTEEWVDYGDGVEKTDRVARRHAKGKIAVCAMLDAGESDEALRAEYRSHGYRLLVTEPVMVHTLKRIPRFEQPLEIRRVLDEDLANRVNKAARARQTLAEHLEEGAPLRQYVALEKRTPVGWVRSIDTGPGTWCSDMYVKPKYRRRGIGRALMERMLRDDRQHGASLAVLTASHTGALLYPLVGYRQIGTLLLYSPK